MALGRTQTADALRAYEVADSLDSGLVFIRRGADHRRIDSPQRALLPERSPASEVLRTGQPMTAPNSTTKNRASSAPVRLALFRRANFRSR